MSKKASDDLLDGIVDLFASDEKLWPNDANTYKDAEGTVYVCHIASGDIPRIYTKPKDGTWSEMLPLRGDL